MHDIAHFPGVDDLRQLVHRFERLPLQEAASVGERGNGEGSEVVTEADSQQVRLGSRVLSLIYGDEFDWIVPSFVIPTFCSC